MRELWRLNRLEESKLKLDKKNGDNGDVMRFDSVHTTSPMSSSLLDIGLRREARMHIGSLAG